jgi:hypothetical protein
MLVDRPWKSGAAFLHRAADEPSRARELIVKAQDQFTEVMAEEGKPLLAARGAFMVGVCDAMLEGPGPVSRRRFGEAIRSVITAYEVAEADRYPPIHSLRFWTWDRRHADVRAHGRFGISYASVACSSTRNGLVSFITKDPFVLGLESSTNVGIPVPCADFMDELCDVHRLPATYFLANNGTQRLFDAGSPTYARARATALVSITALEALGK